MIDRYQRSYVQLLNARGEWNDHIRCDDEAEAIRYRDSLNERYEGAAQFRAVHRWIEEEVLDTISNV
jgi:hypothetical protein